MENCRANAKLADRAYSSQTPRAATLQNLTASLDTRRKGSPQVLRGNDAHLISMLDEKSQDSYAAKILLSAVPAGILLTPQSDNLRLLSEDLGPPDGEGSPSENRRRKARRNC